MVENSQEYRLKYWATRSSVRSHRSLVPLLRTARFPHALRCAHLFARSLTRLLAHSLRSLPHSWESESLDDYLFCVFFSILAHGVIGSSVRNLLHIHLHFGDP